MELKERLVGIKPREKSGADTSHKYDYQKNWALCQILKRHDSGEDYVFIFEHHDDILMLDSEEAPKEICFYQIKTKGAGYWLLSKLLEGRAGKDGPKLSYLGKLYGNKINYPMDTKSLNFVSNAQFSFTLKPTLASTQSLSMPSICAADICDEELSKIRKKLKREYALKEEPTFEDITFFICSDLSLEDHDKHAQGKLNAFLETTFTRKSFKVGPIHRTLFDEIRRKNNFAKDIESFDDLIRYKSISRSRFEEILKSIGVKTDMDEAWSLYEFRLNSEGFQFGELIKIKQEWLQCELDRMDSTNLSIQQLMVAIKTAIGAIEECIKLSDFLTAVYRYCIETLKISESLRSPEYLKAMILMEYYEQQLPKTN